MVDPEELGYSELTDSGNFFTAFYTSGIAMYLFNDIRKFFTALIIFVLLSPVTALAAGNKLEVLVVGVSYALAMETTEDEPKPLGMCDGLEEYFPEGTFHHFGAKNKIDVLSRMVNVSLFIKDIEQVAAHIRDSEADNIIVVLPDTIWLASIGLCTKVNDYPDLVIVDDAHSSMKAITDLFDSTYKKILTYMDERPRTLEEKQEKTTGTLKDIFHPLKALGDEKKQVAFVVMGVSEKIPALKNGNIPLFDTAANTMSFIRYVSTSRGAIAARITQKQKQYTTFTPGYFSERTTEVHQLVKDSKHFAFYDVDQELSTHSGKITFSPDGTTEYTFNFEDIFTRKETHRLHLDQRIYKHLAFRCMCEGAKLLERNPEDESGIGFLKKMTLPEKVSELESFMSSELETLQTELQ